MAGPGHRSGSENPVSPPDSLAVIAFTRYLIQDGLGALALAAPAKSALELRFLSRALFRATVAVCSGSVAAGQ
jgi:hypothetical protein